MIGRIEVAPGFSPYAAPGDGDWVEVGEVLSVSFSRGRQNSTDAYEAGRLDATLWDPDEELDHLLSGSDVEDAGPDTPLRFVVTVRGLDVVRWSGFVLDGFSAPPGRDRTVAVTAVDWMGWAESVAMPDCSWAAWVASMQPAVWFRGYLNRDDLSSGGRAWNQARKTTGNDLHHDNSATDFAARYTEPIVPGKPTVSTTFGFTGTDGALEMTDTLPTVAEWAITVWFRTAPVGTNVWQIHSGSDWSLSMDSGGNITADCDVGGFPQTCTISVDHSDGNVHVVTLRAKTGGSGTKSLNLASDLGTALTTFAATALTGGGSIRIVGNDAVRIDEVAYFDDRSSFVTGQTLADWAAGADFLWFNDTITDRFARHLDTAWVDSPPIEAEFVESWTHTEYRVLPSLAEALRVAGDVGLGGAWATKEGAIRIRDWAYSQSGATPFMVISDDTDGTWDVTQSDTFTRSNSSSTIGGNWSLDPGFGGNFGIISNTAYCVGASAASGSPAHVYQQLGRDVTVSVDLSGAVDGQGVILRRHVDAAGNRHMVTATVANSEQYIFVHEWSAGVATYIGDVLVSDPNGTLTVTADGPTLTVDHDNGTSTTFTLSSTSRVGQGVGLVFYDTSTPANTVRWDNYTATCTRPVVRATTRSRTGPRKDRVVNTLTATLPNGRDVYFQDKASQQRYDVRPLTVNSDSSAATPIVTAAAQLLRPDPPIEVGELSVVVIGDELEEWAALDVELDAPVQYRAATYWGATEVIDDVFRISSETWDAADGTGLTLTLRIVPA